MPVQRVGQSIATYSTALSFSKWRKVWIRDVVLLSDPSTFGAGGPNRNTSRIRQNPPENNIRTPFLTPLFVNGIAGVMSTAVQRAVQYSTAGLMSQYSISNHLGFLGLGFCGPLDHLVGHLGLVVVLQYPFNLRH